MGGLTRIVIPFACAALAFCAAGFGLMALGWAGRNAAPPDEPGSRRRRDRARAGTSLLWGFALLWNTIAAPVLVLVPHELRKGHVLAWVALLFPLVGVVLLANAARLTLRAMRFHDSTLVLDTLPVPIGGTLHGTVEVPHPLPSVSGVLIRLIAMSRRTDGRSTNDSIVADEVRELDPSLIRRTADGAVIPIEIAVPSDAPPSAEGELFWRLTVDADVPGIDYHAAFDVPVARTAFSDFRPHGVPASIGEPRNPTGFVERDTADGRELYFPRFRAPRRAFLSLLFLVAWIAAIAFMVFARVPVVLPIAFGIVAVVMLLSTLELFFESRTIVVGPHHVTLRRRLLWQREQVLANHDVVVATANGMHPYYRVDLETAGGKRVKAATNIRSKREAEWVAGRIRSRS